MTMCELNYSYNLGAASISGLCCNQNTEALRKLRASWILIVLFHDNGDMPSCPLRAKVRSQGKGHQFRPMVTVRMGELIDAGILNGLKTGNSCCKEINSDGW
jgi:hypothetical protein